MEKVCLLGQMEALTKANSKIIIFRDKDNINGLMEENLMDNGLTIRWKVKECLFGLTAEDMKVITLMIRKKV